MVHKYGSPPTYNGLPLLTTRTEPLRGVAAWRFEAVFQPLEVQQQDMIRMVNNVKTDRTALDLLFGCLLEWGLPIDLPITKRTDLGNDTYDVDGGRIIASFDSNVGDAVVKAIANEKPDFAIFRDLSFNNSAAKINVGEIFKAISPNTEVKVL